MKNLSCDKALNLIDKYHDNELSSSQSKNMEIHLSSCNSCRKT